MNEAMALRFALPSFPTPSRRVWPFVLAALAVMAAIIVVASAARERADNSRRAQALVERLHADAAELSALKFEAVLRLQSGDAPPLVAIAPLATRAGTLLTDLGRTQRELRALVSGRPTDQLASDIAELYAAGGRLMAAARGPGRSFGAATQRLLTPGLAHLHSHLETLLREQRQAADDASERAALAFYGALGGGLLTLLVLTLWLERARRRSSIAEEVRAVERRSEARIRALIEHASDVVSVVGEDQVVRWQAASAQRMLGIDPDAAVGRPFTDLVHPDDAERCAQSLQRCAADDGPQIVAARLRHADGTWVNVEAIVSNRLADPAVEGLLLSMRDVGERKALEDRLRHQAFHDPLTGLANRALFEQRLALALGSAQGEHHSVGVLFLDLDDFKTVNDGLGHAAGDALLRTVAGRVAGALRPDDVAARLGGDEFAVLLSAIPDERAALVVADRIAAVLRPDFELDGRRLAVTASIGVALDDGNASVDDLLRNADVAMYGAKERGTGAIRVFEERLHRRAVDRLELSADLPRAIAAGEFELDYQPIVELADGRIAGVEALVRWRHPTRGRLSPAQFIGLAEDTGAIVDLGLWVLRKACRDVRGLQLAGGAAEEIYVSVNVSTKQLRDPRFPDAVAAALIETGLPARALVLELTETLLVHDRDAIMVQLHRLKELGLRLAVDDFGTGYSVLSYLQEFPIDVLKIDKSFVDDIEHQPDKAKLVAGIVGLSESLHLEVVAEGIESDGQADRLREMRSLLGQGYLFSRPVPLAGIETLLGARVETPTDG
jgi:diguanylate cyclase (GGDEF)-like protein/PAS domain S-box-containing protein